MRNLSGYLTTQKLKSKAVVFCVFWVLILLTQPISSIYAAEAEGIETSATIGYTINQSNDLIASIVLEIRNTEELPTPIRYFKTSVPFPQTDVLTVQYSDQYLDIQREPNSAKTNLTIDLQNRILRKGTPFVLIFDIKVRDYFDDNHILFNLPTTYPFDYIDKVNLSLSSSFGQPASIQPNDYTEESLSGGSLYTFREIKGEDISILMEKDLTYRFYQKNTFQNGDSIKKSFDLILPPTNESQKLLLNNLKPGPDRVEIDDEGNILAQYDLDPQSKIEVIAAGFIVKTVEQTEDISTFKNPLYLEKEGYWQLSDGNIIEAQKSLGKIPEEPWQSLSQSKRKSLLKGIGSLVNKKLEPSKPDNEAVSIRLGADALMEGNSNATSGDYVDLTIALLRHYSIPSRQVVGYSTNIQNIYEYSTTHTWVQYWDPQSGWINIDTYQDDLQGTNRIGVSDTDRVILMYRGLDPVFPQYTSYSLDEIAITISNDSVNPITQFDTSYEEIRWELGDKMLLIPISIENTGSTIINKLEILDLDNDVIFSSNLPLIPGQSTQLDIELDQLLLANLKNSGDQALPINVRISTIDDDSETSLYEIPVEFIETWWWNPFIFIASLFTFLLIIFILFEAYHLAKNGKFKIRRK